MRLSQAPPTGGRFQRSVTACLASILEVDLSEVPLPDERHPEPWVVWRNWLAQRGMGLIPVAAPQRFQWPGPWVAVLDTAHGPVAVVAFGVPPGVAWAPLGDEEGWEAVREGYVVAPADVALWMPSPTEAPRRAGRVEAIAIAPAAEADMQVVERATARAGRGLQGDRYFNQAGTFSNAHGRGYDLTLIEAEVIDTLEVRLGAADARRNVITRGIDLNALVGKTFRVGNVRCFGQRLCEPCAHLERLTAAAGTPGTLRALIHKGGLRADILDDGTIATGDDIVVE